MCGKALTESHILSTQAVYAWHQTKEYAELALGKVESTSPNFDAAAILIQQALDSEKEAIRLTAQRPAQNNPRGDPYASDPTRKDHAYNTIDKHSGMGNEAAFLNDKAGRNTNLNTHHSRVSDDVDDLWANDRR